MNRKKSPCDCKVAVWVPVKGVEHQAVTERVDGDPLAVGRHRDVRIGAGKRGTGRLPAVGVPDPGGGVGEYRHSGAVRGHVKAEGATVNPESLSFSAGEGVPDHDEAARVEPLNQH